MLQPTIKHLYSNRFIIKATMCIKDLEKEILTTQDKKYLVWCWDIIKNLNILIKEISKRDSRKKRIKFTPDIIRALCVLIDYSPTDEV